MITFPTIFGFFWINLVQLLDFSGLKIVQFWRFWDKIVQFWIFFCTKIV
nr:MAG TPA: hypothetical protein [Caudoviricetes sp.]